MVKFVIDIRGNTKIHWSVLGFETHLLFLCLLLNVLFRETLIVLFRETLIVSIEDTYPDSVICQGYACLTFQGRSQRNRYGTLCNTGCQKVFIRVKVLTSDQ
jgi:hypothetical protein